MNAAWILAAASLMTPPEAAVPVVDRAIADVARRHAVKARLVEIEAVTWRDGSLGCAKRKGIAATQALVPGWRIILAAGSRSFEYHASQAGQLVLCPPGQAEKPLPAPPT